MLLRAFWAKLGIRPNSGVTDADLDAFEHRCSLRLPEEVREYFRRTNGMALGPGSRDTDEDLIRFYPLAECRRLGDEWPESGVADADRFLCFADYSIWAWGYGIRLDDGPDNGSVHVLYASDTAKVADSFDEFLHSYLRRDYSVTYPR